MKLKDKVIVITGGAGGLGQAMAESCFNKGAKVAIIDLAQEALDKALETLPTARGYAANICDESQVESTFKQIVSELGAVDAVINSAGILRDGLLIKQRDDTIHKASLAHFNAVLDVNLTGTFLCGREAAYHMVENQTKGVIINISSISRAGNFGQSNYSASKSGVDALAVTWSKELARHGIRAAAIAPGFIATDMTASMPPAALEKVAASIPVGRMGTPEEIAAGAIFILENEFFNGSVLEINGGLRL